eukprot:jgi/Bigna1/135680/aug1.30_g10388
MGENQNYDIFLVYYGDQPNVLEKYQKSCRWVVQHKGSKVQNFYSVLFNERREIFNQSDYIMSLDDDIYFRDGVEGINTMFAVARKYGLKQAMPALVKSKRTKGYWGTVADYDDTENLVLKYTSVVEHNSVIASREAWEKTMNIYDPVIIGFGMPHLAVCANGVDDEGSYAVVHKVLAENPATRKETGRREGEQIPGWYDRMSGYNEYAEKINCPKKVEAVNYASVIDDDHYHHHHHHHQQQQHQNYSHHFEGGETHERSGHESFDDETKISERNGTTSSRSNIPGVISSNSNSSSSSGNDTLPFAAKNKTHLLSKKEDEVTDTPRINEVSKSDSNGSSSTSNDTLSIAAKEQSQFSPNGSSGTSNDTLPTAATKQPQFSPKNDEDEVKGKPSLEEISKSYDNGSSGTSNDTLPTAATKQPQFSPKNDEDEVKGKPSLEEISKSYDNGSSGTSNDDLSLAAKKDDDVKGQPPLNQISKSGGNGSRSGSDKNSNSNNNNNNSNSNRNDTLPLAAKNRTQLLPRNDNEVTDNPSLKEISMSDVNSSSSSSSSSEDTNKESSLQTIKINNITNETGARVDAGTLSQQQQQQQQHVAQNGTIAHTEEGEEKKEEQLIGKTDVGTQDDDENDGDNHYRFEDNNNNNNNNNNTNTTNNNNSEAHGDSIDDPKVVLTKAVAPPPPPPLPAPSFATSPMEGTKVALSSKSGMNEQSASVGNESTHITTTKVDSDEALVTLKTAARSTTVESQTSQTNETKRDLSSPASSASKTATEEGGGGEEEEEVEGNSTEKNQLGGEQQSDEKESHESLSGHSQSSSKIINGARSPSSSNIDEIEDGGMKMLDELSDAVNDLVSSSSSSSSSISPKIFDENQGQRKVVENDTPTKDSNEQQHQQQTDNRDKDPPLIDTTTGEIVIKSA